MSIVEFKQLFLIGDDGIYLCSLDDIGKMLNWKIGRTKNDSASDAIEFDECRRRSELARCCDEHRSAAKVVAPTVESGSSDQVIEGYA